MKNFRYGNTLSHLVQKELLSKYVHRYTNDHIPKWAQGHMPNGQPYPVQFDSDKEWLERTLFMVTKYGKLDKRSNRCFSSPTWPDKN